MKRSKRRSRRLPRERRAQRKNHRLALERWEAFQASLAEWTAQCLRGFQGY